MRDQILQLPDAELLRQCDVSTYRASGPGGQKRNKTESAVRLRHEPTDLMVIANESRSQHENRVRALRRLRERIGAKVRNTIDLTVDDVPGGLTALLSQTPGARPARRSPAHMVAMAQLLDLFAATNCSVADTARCLGLGTAAASRLLMETDWVAREVNEMRGVRGLRRLRRG